MSRSGPSNLRPKSAPLPQSERGVVTKQNDTSSMLQQALRDARAASGPKRSSDSTQRIIRPSSGASAAQNEDSGRHGAVIMVQSQVTGDVRRSLFAEPLAFDAMSNNMHRVKSETLQRKETLQPPEISQCGLLPLEQRRPPLEDMEVPKTVVHRQRLQQQQHQQQHELPRGAAVAPASNAFGLSNNELEKIWKTTRDLVATLFQQPTQNLFASTTKRLSGFIRLLLASGDDIAMRQQASTPRMKATIIALAAFASTPSVVDGADVAVCELLSSLWLILEGNALPLLFTAEEVRDTLVAMVPFATTPLAADNLLFSFGRILTGNNITSDTRAAQYSTTAVRDALIVMVPYSKTAIVAESVLGSIRTVVSVKSTNAIDLYATEQIRDLLVGMMEVAKTHDAANSFLLIVTKLMKSPYASELFATTEVRDSLVTRIAPFATTSILVSNFSFVVANIVANHPAAPAFYATKEVRDAFCGMVASASEPRAASRLVLAVGNIVQCNTTSVKVLFATKFIADLVSLARVPGCASCLVLVALTSLVADDDQVQALLSTKEVSNALVRIARVVSTPAAACDLLSVMAKIVAKNPQAQDFFATSEVRDQLVALVPFITSSNALCHFSLAIVNIVSSSAAAQNLFTTVQVRDALVRMASVAMTAPDAAAGLAVAIGNIVIDNQNAKVIFSTKEVRDTLVTIVSTFFSAELSVVDGVDDDNMSDIVHHVAFAFANIVAFNLKPYVCSDEHCSNNPGGMALFATNEVKDVLTVLAHIVDKNDLVLQHMSILQDFFQVNDQRRSILLSKKFAEVFGVRDLFADQSWFDHNGIHFSGDVQRDSPAWNFVMKRTRTPLLEKAHIVTRLSLVCTESDVFFTLHERERVSRAQNPELCVDLELSVNLDRMAAIDKLKAMFEDLIVPQPGARIVFAWHGVPANAVTAVCRDGPRNFRKTDGGYFGAGSYFALEAEYAAKYSARDGNGERAVILFAVSVSQAYPVTLETDYRTEAEEFSASFGCRGFSKFYSPDPKLSFALTARCDAHFIPVKYYGYKHPVTGFASPTNLDCQAAPAGEAEFHELVVSSHSRCLPIAVMYLKDKK
ncbi:Hypothetical protein, putative [Bodo saltans]|uniref:PARP catalytic domain-containing protein n=1 Tax=Bodo saltans TaxID=75058 RepID=A0A0S4JH68_BODSA|nr:Hypothetical protein, putative [Bodo saltans]|eukprot:CUG88587.1 Hypothetical protein, putative [Bodo saltans]